VQVSSLIVGVCSGLGGAALSLAVNHAALMKRLTQDERNRWNGLPLGTRSWVRKTVRRGGTVDDPALAHIAAEIAASTPSSRVGTAIVLCAALLFAGLAAVLAVDGPPAMAGLSGLAALALGWVAVRAVPRQQARIARAEVQNRALAQDSARLLVNGGP
jgi:hypothetical protein